MDEIIDDLGDFINDILPDEKVKPVNHVIFLLDISGSMRGKEQFMVDTFNEQMDVIRKIQDQDTFVSLITFNDVYSIIYYEEEVKFIKDLKLDEIEPMGSTALFDSLGNIITNLHKDVEKLSDKINNHSALINVITDGGDNVSKDYSHKKVKSLMKEMETYETWTFTFAGVDFDVINEYGNLNVNAGNTINISANIEGLKQFSTGMENFYNMRSAGQTVVNDYYDSENTHVHTIPDIIKGLTFEHEHEHNTHEHGIPGIVEEINFGNELIPKVMRVASVPSSGYVDYSAEFNIEADIEKKLKSRGKK